MHHTKTALVSIILIAFLKFGACLAPSFWMQFMFCYYEVFFFSVMAIVKLDLKKLNTEGSAEGFFEALNVLLRKIKAFQDTFALFLLVNLSFMTLLWIIQLYTVYVSIKDDHFKTALGSFFVVVAELWRVFTITSECDKYEVDVKNTVNNVKEKKRELVDTDKIVSILK